MPKQNSHALQIVFILLAGVLFVGQDCPAQCIGPDPCEGYVAQMLSQDCENQVYANIDAHQACLVACGEDDPCEDQCDANWYASIQACLPGINELASGVCGSCYASCFADIRYPEGCLGGSQTGTECADELVACVNGC